MPLDNKSIIDVCCGSRMFWFDRENPDVVFMDIRKETLETDSRQGRRAIVIDPDLQGDFTNIPFPDAYFTLVVFDPPHLLRNGKTSWMAKKYGTLKPDWQEMLRKGFTECWRVLKPGGTLVFKWNDLDVSVSQVLELAPARPLIGNRCGKNARTHWIIFLKS
ncbi:MAG: class I SAM-dependent methyltransferase [Verrucomicrobiota bacterium]|nr:class I SAM-dependent methyltransferase [Verrucomicrobiota bacterium]